MDILEAMDASVGSFSKTDRLIYERIRKFPESHAQASIAEIAKGSHVSKAALTRFAKRLGFGGFAEFQYQLRQDLAQHREGAPSNAEVYSALLPAVDAALDRDALAALAARMRASRAVHVLGANLSRLAAEELYMALAYTPELCAALPPLDVEPGVGAHDTVLVYSAIMGAAHAGLVRRLAAREEGRPHLALVTTNSKHPLRRHFDEVFVLPTATLASGTRAVLADTFAFLMFNDALTGLLEGADVPSGVL